ncbi:RNase adapter RapZ [Sphingosinicella sp. LY1275]|uniref:RNase adapter RapZ n=1 Tax=Sphingosinicella sp. LY1275 TaxID=3095379 RepID=UPI002ADEE407|nr:RNase adapter RapZ [Sphingosinicella sp. LY1275]MEA1013555.1 RNase adapter RapZ [Sphingosinicella sp. LY1275]
MKPGPAPKRILLVTGLSGAGKSTVLRTLEDIGWEVVDNLPLSMLEALLSTPLAKGASRRRRPLALGIDSRTRDFDANSVVQQIKELAGDHAFPVETLYLDCAGSKLLQRYSETRRRHPLALDRPATDGIAAERDLMEPLRRWAEYIIDTTDTDSNALQQQIRHRFGTDLSPYLHIMSFGFARGLPRNADTVFDMRFLKNPHWEDHLRPLTGLDAPVGDYIATDESYEPAVARIEELLLLLLPRYRSEGKSYVSIAFGCTGGRHRSVHVAERVATRLREAGFSPTVEHRDLASRPRDLVEGDQRAQLDI